MEFTLPQLTPGNLKLIFEAAAYTVTDCQEHTMEDGKVKKYGGIAIEDGGQTWTISPYNDSDHIRFGFRSYVAKKFIDQSTAELMLLRISNYYDNLPVHGQYIGQDEAGDHIFDFENSAIFPSGESVEGVRIIKIFRTFQRMVENNRSLFFELYRYVQEQG